MESKSNLPQEESSMITPAKQLINQERERQGIQEVDLIQEES